MSRLESLVILFIQVKRCEKKIHFCLSTLLHRFRALTNCDFHFKMFITHKELISVFDANIEHV